MENIQKFFLELTQPGPEPSAEAHQEHMVKVVAVMMAITLFTFSIPIAIGWGLVTFDQYTILTLVVFDLLAGTTAVLALRGQWKMARIIPILLFLGFGFYGNYMFGSATTFLLFYALAVILTSVFYNRKILFVILLVSMVGPPTMELLRGDPYFPLHMNVPIFIMAAGLLTGIGLTQWYSMEQLKRALKRSDDYAEELAKERDLIGNIMKILPVGICMLDAEGNFTYTNRFMREIFGAEENEILQESLESISWRVTDIEEASPPTRQVPLADIIRTRTPVQDARYAIQLDNRKILISANATPLFDPKGNFDGVAVVAQNITDNVLAVQALRESEQKYRNIVESIPIGLHTYKLVGDDLIFTDANPAADAILGINHDGYSGKKIEEICSGLLGTEFHGECRHVAQTGMNSESKTYFYEGEHKSGVFECKGFQTSAGTMTVAFQDISERVHSEEALRNSEERFRQIAENVREVFWVGTPEWSEVIYISPTYQYTWGRSVQSLYDDPGSWLDSVLEADRDKVIAFMQKVTDGDFSTPYFPEYRIVLPDGSLRWISARVFPVIDAQGKVYRITGIAEDITERKQVEEELWESQERYQLATKAGQVGVWDWDLATDEIYIDSNSIAMLGDTRSEARIRLEEWVVMVHPEDVDRVLKALNDQIAGKTKEYEASYRMIHGDGSLRWFLARGNVVLDSNGDPVRMVGTIADITGRVEMEAAIQEREARISSIFRAAPIGVGVVSERVLLELNDRICEMTGYSFDELIGKNARMLYPTQEEFEQAGEGYMQLDDYHIGTVETRWRHKDGRIIDVLLSATPLDMDDLSVGYTFTALDITERKRAQEALAKREATLSTIFRTAPVGIGLARERLFVEVNERMCEMTGYSHEELLGQNAQMLYDSQEEMVQTIKEVGKQLREKGVAIVETRNRRKDGTLYDILLNVALIDPDDFSAGTISIAMDITESKRAQEALAEREATLNSIFQAAPASISLTRAGVRIEANEHMCETTGYSRAELLGKSGRMLYETEAEFKQAGAEMIRQIQEKGTAVIETRTLRKDGTKYDALVHFAPIDPNDISAGLAIVSLDITERKQHERELETFITLATALREVDKRNEMIPIVLNQIIDLMSGNGAAIALLDKDTGDLVFELGIGISEKVTGKVLSKGKGIAGSVMENRAPYVSDDLANDPNFLNFEGLPMPVAGTAVPLIAEGEIIGVLWLFKDHAFAENDVRILTIIAELSANSLHRATLFENLENSNLELAVAYDTTLEGWAKALELRDKETEGHSRNVTDLTLRLAQRLGLNGEVLVHMRRGALLHDIGKMGISDAILLKPGPLDDAEWEVMRQHPVYAYELLYPIPFLEKALEIPYCHHEKWDGSGYPRGLSGENIPLAARIFTLVDYWDALNSDRPYRGAWPEDKIKEYIKANMGSIFDPRIAGEFLDMMRP